MSENVSRSQQAAAIQQEIIALEMQSREIQQKIQMRDLGNANRRFVTTVDPGHRGSNYRRVLATRECNNSTTDAGKSAAANMKATASWSNTQKLEGNITDDDSDYDDVGPNAMGHGQSHRNGLNAIMQLERQRGVPDEPPSEPHRGRYTNRHTVNNTSGPSSGVGLDPAKDTNNGFPQGGKGQRGNRPARNPVSKSKNSPPKPQVLPNVSSARQSQARPQANTPSDGVFPRLLTALAAQTTEKSKKRQLSAESSQANQGRRGPASPTKVPKLDTESSQPSPRRNPPRAAAINRRLQSSTRPLVSDATATSGSSLPAVQGLWNGPLLENPSPPVRPATSTSQWTPSPQNSDYGNPTPGLNSRRIIEDDREAYNLPHPARAAPSAFDIETAAPRPTDTNNAGFHAQNRVVSGPEAVRSSAFSTVVSPPLLDAADSAELSTREPVEPCVTPDDTPQMDAAALKKLIEEHEQMKKRLDEMIAAFEKIQLVAHLPAAATSINAPAPTESGVDTSRFATTTASTQNGSTQIDLIQTEPLQNRFTQNGVPFSTLYVPGSEAHAIAMESEENFYDYIAEQRQEVEKTAEQPQKSAAGEVQEATQQTTAEEHDEAISSSDAFWEYMNRKRGGNQSKSGKKKPGGGGK